MDFGHDTAQALGTVAALVNTCPELAGHDALPDVEALEQFVTTHRISEIGRLRPRDLDQVRQVRAALRAVVSAPDDATAIAQVNALVADARTTPRLTDHDGFPLHVHYFAPGASLAEHLAADGGMDVAHVLAAGERDRFRSCAAPDGERVLVDLSRNRSRRYCDARTCGNRLHVAAYRARRRAG